MLKNEISVKMIIWAYLCFLSIKAIEKKTEIVYFACANVIIISVAFVCGYYSSILKLI